MIRMAFKEWSVICKALAVGRQAIILRKGGIAEEGGTFRPEHARFWLYPTYVHQKADAVRPALHPWLHEPPPPTGELHLTHYAEVPTVYHIAREEELDALHPFHGWTLATVRQRFHYRTPGLFVLPVRVFAVSTPLVVPELPEYDGCKTWVDLGNDYPAEGTPVMNDVEFAQLHGMLTHHLASRAP